MRRSNGAMILTHNGVPVAINLGADHCAEHEWGVKSTYREFGIDSDKIGRDPIGIVGRTVKRVSPSLRLQDFNMKPTKKSDMVGYVGSLLILKTSYSTDDTIDPSKLRDFYAYPEYIKKADENGRVRTTDEKDHLPLTTAWSDGDFAVFARKPEEVQFLKDLFAAFQNNDVAIWMGKTMPDNPFENAGLVLGIVSRMPADIIDGFAKADQDRLDLEAMDEATGIKARLEAAGEQKDAGRRSFYRPFGYYALSPRKIDADRMKEVGTAHPVIYWLNPQDQENVNYGWFTVEQLDQWIAGKGPIPGGRKERASA